MHLATSSPRARLTFALMTLLLLGLTVQAWPSDSPQERATLKGLTAFDVVVEKLSPEAERDGLTIDQLHSPRHRCCTGEATGSGAPWMPSGRIRQSVYPGPQMSAPNRQTRAGIEVTGFSPKVQRRVYTDQRRLPLQVYTDCINVVRDSCSWSRALNTNWRKPGSSWLI